MVGLALSRCNHYKDLCSCVKYIIPKKRASELLNNGDITGTIEQLQQHHQKRHDITVDRITNELYKAKDDFSDITTRVRVGFAEYYKKGCLAGNNYSVIKKPFTTDKQG